MVISVTVQSNLDISNFIGPLAKHQNIRVSISAHASGHPLKVGLWHTTGNKILQSQAYPFPIILRIQMHKSPSKVLLIYSYLLSHYSQPFSCSRLFSPSSTQNNPHIFSSMLGFFLFWLAIINAHYTLSLNKQHVLS